MSARQRGTLLLAAGRRTRQAARRRLATCPGTSPPGLDRRQAAAPTVACLPGVKLTQGPCVDMQEGRGRLRAMNASIRGLMLLSVLLVSCKEAARPGAPAEVQLSTDLNPGMVDTALGVIARNGGPRAERIGGMHAGVSSLPGSAGAPIPGAEQAPKPEALGDVRWDNEPYGAIAAATKGELLPAPPSGADVPPLWK